MSRRRRDPHHPGRVVAIGRLASVAGDRQAGHADPLASKGFSVVLAVEIKGTGTSANSRKPAAPDRADGDGQSDVGRGTDRCGAPGKAWDSGVAAHGSTVHAVAPDAAFEDGVTDVEHVCAQSRKGRTRVRLLRRGHRNVSRGVRVCVLEVGTRRVVHWNTTEHPTADWTAQQFRMTISGDPLYRYVIHDRDSIYSEGVDRTLAAMGLTVLRTPVRAPQANAFCERLVGTVRRECLDFSFR